MDFLCSCEHMLSTRYKVCAYVQQTPKQNKPTMQCKKRRSKEIETNGWQVSIPFVYNRFFNFAFSASFVV